MKKFGIPVAALSILALGIILVTVLGANGKDDEIENPKIVGLISYTVTDAQGNVKDTYTSRNTTLAALLDASSDRLHTASTIAEADLFDNLQVCSADASGGACTLTDFNGASAGAGTNPADTTATGTVGGDTSAYEVSNQFTCTTTTCTLEEVQLVAGSAVDGTADTNRGAWNNIAITLNDTDSVTFTWQVDID